MRKIERRCVERWSLRQMLNVFERGDVTRLEAALTVDILDKGELTDPVSECLRLAIRDKAMALVECGEA
ncbi:hypothetical protein [Methylosinus sp. RM1]|uniref:hypothetical protein n=1 Tax=Methylosinus sp. RM1 TaxID=2583817 RepID=UPI00140A4CA0|nr:hypothetical protein [Methylosinus sp. RM1]